MTTQEHGGDRHSAAAQLSAAERASEALRLRLMRVPYRQIARSVGYASPASAYRAVERALKNLPRENATALRTQELEALDLAQRTIMPSVLAGHLGAVDRLLKIMDARARISGLYDIAADSGVEEFKTVLRVWAASIAKQVDAEEPLPADSEQITEREETNP